MIKHPPLTAKSIIASTRNFIQWVGKDRLEQQIDKMIKQEVAGLQAEIATLQMCAIAGEAMGVEMLKLETQKEQLIKDIQQLRSALGKFDEMYEVICDMKDNEPSQEHHEGLTLFINLCLRYGKPALTSTDRPEYKEEG